MTDETISKPLIIPIHVEDLDEGMTMLLGPTAPATSTRSGLSLRMKAQPRFMP